MKRVWHGEASDDLVGETGRIAAAVAKRLADPAAVFANLMGHEGADRAPDSPHDIQTFSHGLPGVLMLHSELDRACPDQGWDSDVHGLIKALVESINSHGVPAAGLYVGAAGHGFAVWTASCDGMRYANLLGHVNIGLAQLIRVLLQMTGERKGHCAVSDYDAVQGLAGIGRYLMHQAEAAELRTLLDATLDYLIGLSNPVEQAGIEAPGWFVPQQHQMTIADAEQFPEGNFNTGLAHGIAGPLALLSLAYSAGHRRPKQAEAIDRMAGWLVDVCEPKGGVSGWPGRISWQAHVGRQRVAASEHDGWCYGTPGITRALYLAGLSLEDTALRRFALSGFREFILARPALEMAAGPALCHGRAGILQIALRMGAASGDHDILKAAERLAEIVVADYDPNSRLGYRDVEERESGAVAVDRAGFLNGAAGVALVLATYGSAAAPVWDRALLIS